MSDRLTEIDLPGVSAAGLAEWGRKTVPEMIETLRRHAAEQKRAADAILKAPDTAFRVTTYVGPHARHDIEVLQEGRP